MSKRVSYPKSSKETTFACFSQIPHHQGHPRQTHTIARTMHHNHTHQIHIKLHRPFMDARRCLRTDLSRQDMDSILDTRQPAAMKS